MIDLLLGVYHCGRGTVNVKSHKIGGDFFGIFLPLSGGTTKKRGCTVKRDCLREKHPSAGYGQKTECEAGAPPLPPRMVQPSMCRPRKAAMVWANLYSASPVAMPGVDPTNSTNPSRSPSARMGAATLVMSLSLLSDTRMG